MCMFCAPEHIFGGTEGIGSRFHVLRSRSFMAVPRASGAIFMFCTPELVLGSTVGVESLFYVL
jgi:hypothetical protein